MQEGRNNSTQILHRRVGRPTRKDASEEAWKKLAAFHKTCREVRIERRRLAARPPRSPAPSLGPKQRKRRSA